MTVGKYTWYPYFGYITITKEEDTDAKVIPQLNRTVGFLYIHYQGKYKPIGTCFFTAIREHNLVFVYLITCKHVIKEYVQHLKIYVRLNRSDKKDVAYIPLDGGWVYHNDDAVDLAIIQYIHPPNIPCDFEPVDIETVFLSDEHLKPAKYKITEGDVVAFIGLFDNVTGIQRNFPIHRHGHIAMVIDEKVEGVYGDADYELIECRAYSGNSGSPVYVQIPYPTNEEPFQFLVFIFGVLTAINLQQQFPISDDIMKQENSGISLVVPIDIVKEVLYGVELMNDRKKKVKDSRSSNNKARGVSIKAGQQDESETDFTRDDFMDALNKIVKPADEDEQ